MSGTVESPRRLARELVLQALYAEDAGGSRNEIVSGIIKDPRLSQRQHEFAETLFRTACEYKQWADDQIGGLADNWDIERIARIDRIVMRMALVELMHLPDSPVKVVLNEAIELAKKFSTAESSRFVNGLLDRFVKDAQLLGRPSPTTE